MERLSVTSAGLGKGLSCFHWSALILRKQLAYRIAGRHRRKPKTDTPYPNHWGYESPPAWLLAAWLHNDGFGRRRAQQSGNERATAFAWTHSHPALGFAYWYVQVWISELLNKEHGFLREMQLQGRESDRRKEPVPKGPFVLGLTSGGEPPFEFRFKE
jgi:hypothetical protein